MPQLANTLFVTTQGAYLRLEYDTIKIVAEGEKPRNVPLHHLGGIVCFGNVMPSPALMHRCAEDGRDIVFLSRSGRFRARVNGPTSGNVLLRRAQYAASDNELAALDIARPIVAGKVQNSRQLLLRSAREHTDGAAAGVLRAAATQIGNLLAPVARAGTLDELRGYEGDAARMYYDIFPWMIRANKDEFRFHHRNRRPPRDPVNALLSFLYTLLTGDCVAAAETVGLDPQVGFLHRERPGRPSLALDLMEELRPAIADRMVLSLINRRQIQPDDFVERAGGSFRLTDDARKEVLKAWQRRKQEEVRHPVLDQHVELGLIPQVQARLLARHLRGDLNEYLPWIIR